ncbi:MAG: indole-3-glycerol-phosphate synthase [Thermocladium sp.]
MGFLDDAIIAARRRVETERAEVEPGDMRRAIEEDNGDNRLGLIVEYKRMSPSGVINLGIDPWTYFSMLKDTVTGFSVLAEPIYFGGNYIFVKAAAATGRPVLFKDFVVDKHQIDVARSLGASAVLIIYRALSREERGVLINYAHEKGLQVLLEVDNASDAVAALDEFPGEMLGVNSRNLDNLSLSLESVIDVIRGIRGRADIIIAESGVSSGLDAERLARAGANAVLVGTAIMRNPRLAVELRGVRIRG